MEAQELISLYWPVDKASLQQIEASGWKRFPKPNGASEDCFPVFNEGFAVEISHQRQLPQSGSSFVCSFAIPRASMQKFRIEKSENSFHDILKILGDEVDELNNSIIGDIKVTRAHRIIPKK